ncbi:MAG: nucleotidyltransferase family protein [Candidatus Caldarchaeum sp.]
MPLECLTSAMLSGAVIASGFSQRFGRDKLSAALAGRPLLAWAVEAISFLKHRAVVLQPSDVNKSLIPPDYTVLVNTRASRGLSAGIRLAASWTPAESEGLVIVLGDMPFTKSVVKRLVDVFRSECCEAVSACLAGEPSPPAVFSKKLLQRLLMLEGDVGAKSILKTVGARVVEVDERLLTDVDTVEDLAKAEKTFEELGGFKYLD